MLFFYAFYSCSIAGELFSNGSDLGKWWQKSSKSFETMPEPILYHLEGNYSFNELSGNADVKIQNADLSLTLRKKIFTSQTIYGQKRNRTIIAVGKTETFMRKNNLIQLMTFDLIPDLSFQCGASWEENSAKYITDRYRYFAGFLTQQVVAKYVNLSVGAFFGRDETTYDNVGIKKLLPASSPVKYVDLPKYETNGLMLMNKLRFPITKQIYFMQNGEYMTYFENSDYYHWTLDVTVNFVVIKGLSFFVKYKMDYENNSYINYGRTYLGKLNDILTSFGMNDVGNLHNENDMFCVGINVSL